QSFDRFFAAVVRHRRLAGVAEGEVEVAFERAKAIVDALLEQGHTIAQIQEIVGHLTGSCIYRLNTRLEPIHTRIESVHTRLKPVHTHLESFHTRIESV